MYKLLIIHFKNGLMEGMMVKRYRVLRANPVIIAIAGLILCIFVAGMGKAAKSVAVWSAQGKRPIYSVETDKPMVSLGINCAWGNEDIPQLLEVLDKYNVKATFFIVGDWCDRFPESVKQIYDTGHEIGSHSDTHADMTKLDDEGILREIRASRKKLEAVTGGSVTLFRVPSGAYNSRVIELIENEGMYPVQWDCDSIDYKNPTPEQMRERIMKKLGNGSIMLFHSGAKNTPAALPMVIEAVNKEGYSFVKVSELIYKKPYVTDHAGRQKRT